jgi:hypothetical protein
MRMGDQLILSFTVRKEEEGLVPYIKVRIEKGYAVTITSSQSNKTIARPNHGLPVTYTLALGAKISIVFWLEWSDLRLVAENNLGSSLNTPSSPRSSFAAVSATNVVALILTYCRVPRRCSRCKFSFNNVWLIVKKRVICNDHNHSGTETSQSASPPREYDEVKAILDQSTSAKLGLPMQFQRWTNSPSRFLAMLLTEPHY